MPRGRTSEYVTKITQKIDAAKTELRRIDEKLHAYGRDSAIKQAEIAALESALDLARNTQRKRTKPAPKVQTGEEALTTA